ncbi:hypothetical protein LVJ82_05970 [Vitreoscilla massiliensis]|uniref:Uncharacterized protein n=1 Tax=Vitreoscilla massiliensis TaxID=1689272 RepID=A0ABY4E417_9NEIS|nr:hypothetical protein [Vitreoscilla massiliensis]UOO90519.1 hypothetical protein LVJ82_05970 [Vitreoscilla massiliensis]
MENPYQTPKRKIPKHELTHLNSKQLWLKIIALVVLACLFLPALFYGLCFLILSTSGMNDSTFLIGGLLGLVVALLTGYGFMKLLRWRGDDKGDV